MADQTTPKTFEQIQQEYASLCTRAGHIQYQRFAMKSDLEVINNQLRDLNFAAAALKSPAPEAPGKIVTNITDESATPEAPGRIVTNVAADAAPNDASLASAPASSGAV